jgi:hypothetical protein
METIKKINLFIDDLDKIKSSFYNKLAKLGVFGSILNKEVEQINDIDLALFIKDISFNEAKKKAESLLLSKKVIVSQANGTYIRHEEPKPQNYFHLIILNSDNPNKKFMEINKDRILYI